VGRFRTASKLSSYGTYSSARGPRNSCSPFPRFFSDAAMEDLHSTSRRLQQSTAFTYYIDSLQLCSTPPHCPCPPGNHSSSSFRCHTCQLRKGLLALSKPSSGRNIFGAILSTVCLGRYSEGVTWLEMEEVQKFNPDGLGNVEKTSRSSEVEANQASWKMREVYSRDF